MIWDDNSLQKILNKCVYTVTDNRCMSKWQYEYSVKQLVGMSDAMGYTETGLACSAWGVLNYKNTNFWSRSNGAQKNETNKA